MSAIYHCKTVRTVLTRPLLSLSTHTHTKRERPDQVSARGTVHMYAPGCGAHLRPHLGPDQGCLKIWVAPPPLYRKKSRVHTFQSLESLQTREHNSIGLNKILKQYSSKDVLQFTIYRPCAFFSQDLRILYLGSKTSFRTIISRTLTNLS